jgi:cyclopropane fatty-acyl-phospholipid synthase-like methyltransferase
MTAQEIKIAKATSRSAGASVIKDGKIRAVVPLWVESNVDKSKTILDFGAGKGATSTKYLLSKGFDVVAYDLWVGNGDVLLDKFALNRRYDIVFASNVLNVQSSKEMLLETLNQIKSVLKDDGEFICNFPISPRKMEMNGHEMEEVLTSIFPNVSIVGGTKSAPIWKVVKSKFI